MPMAIPVANKSTTWWPFPNKRTFSSSTLMPTMSSKLATTVNQIKYKCTYATIPQNINLDFVILQQPLITFDIDYCNLNVNIKSFLIPE